LKKSGEFVEDNIDDIIKPKDKDVIPADVLNAAKNILLGKG
jgi:hypothetical protein